MMRSSTETIPAQVGLLLLALLGLLLSLSSCASRPQAAGTQQGSAVPFSLCRSFGTAGTPCYPTNVDIGSRVVSPCRDRGRGRCELVGPRTVMACLLLPVPDGKACGEGSVCRDGDCVKQ